MENLAANYSCLMVSHALAKSRWMMVTYLLPVKILACFIEQHDRHNIGTWSREIILIVGEVLEGIRGQVKLHHDYSKKSALEKGLELQLTKMAKSGS